MSKTEIQPLPLLVGLGALRGKYPTAATLVVSYSGYADSGSIEDITLEDAEARQVRDTEIDEKLLKQVEDLAYAKLEEAYPGWEIDDGAYGSFRFDLKTFHVSWEHNIKRTEVTTSEHDFEAAP